MGTTPTNGNQPPGGPWATLEALRGVAEAERSDHLDKWMEQVALLPDYEQDALLTRGREVFGYRMETIRKHLKEIPVAGVRGPAEVKLTVATSDILAEAAYREAPEPETGYLVYKWNDPGPLEWVDTITVGSKQFRPPSAVAAAKGIVLFPSGGEYYDDEQDIYTTVQDFLDSYIQFENDDVKELLTTYIFYTWIADRLDIAPYLRFLGDFSSGKTTALKVACHVVYRGIFAAGAATAAPLFRVIDRYRGTLVLDEADFDQRNLEWQQILKILLVGHSKGQRILRAERVGDNASFEPEGYDPFGPKIIASRRPFNDQALESRCLNVHMQLIQQLDPKRPLFPDAEFYQRAAQLRNQLLWWRCQHYHVTINPRERVLGNDIEPRLNASALALLSAVDRSDVKRWGDLTSLIRGYSEALKDRRRESPEGSVVEAIITQWSLQQHPPRLQLTKVVEEVRKSFEDISSERVSGIIRGPLHLHTQRANGYSWVRTTSQEMANLAKRYGLEPRPARTPVGTST